MVYQQRRGRCAYFLSLFSLFRGRGIGRLAYLLYRPHQPTTSRGWEADLSSTADKELIIPIPSELFPFHNSAQLRILI